MSHQISYTVDEISKLLKVSKLTVYDLIKKGSLPTFKVGRQMRVRANDLELFMHGSKINSPTPPITTSNEQQLSRTKLRQISISGQDLVLDILGKHLEKRGDYKVLRSYEGSLNSLFSMYKGECDIVSLHMFDGETATYNIPYVKKILIGFPYTIIHLLSRKAGFMVQKGNPLQIRAWIHLTQSNVRLVNREIGSGARILLEEQLRLHQISAKAIMGYENEESTHLSVASSIAAGKADVGIGIEKVAKMVDLDFVPLISESYDLVIMNKLENEPLLALLIEILNTDSFKKEIKALSDYDISRTGEIIFQST